MGYQALLFCPDEKLARVVSQVLGDLDFSVETATEPFAAVKKLMAQHFDAVVVDCDNEQNATLLFKSARNSSSNQSSLAVAVVEGQAGVAKAFRIGANLVLTKPINVEQAKGTLRVARGLLRKGGDAKASPANSQLKTPGALPPQISLFERASSKPVLPPVRKPAFVEPKPPLPPLVAASVGPIEVEREQAPSLDAADAALLDSLPGPEPTPRPTKDFAWQPAKSRTGPMAAAFQRAAENAASATKQTQTPPARGNQSGAAAAPAMAKDLFESPVAPTGTKQLESRVSYAESTSATATPSFSPFETDDDAEDGAKSKKPYFIVAAIIIVGATAYYGWTLKYGSTSESTPAAPAAVTTTEAAPTQSVAAPSQVEIAKPSPQTPVEEDSSARTTHPAAASQSKPSLIAEDTVTKIAPIVVKSDASRAARTPAPASEPAPEAPSLSASSLGSDAAISSLVATTSTTVPKRPAQTLRISQGVSQGLVLKRVQPVYPPQAMQMRLQGAVQMLATISKEGTISNLNVLSGDAILARAASEAVKQWKYKPYYLNGQPVEIQTQITVNFKLPN